MVVQGFGSASDWRSNKGGSSYQASSGGAYSSSGYSGWKPKPNEENYTFVSYLGHFCLCLCLRTVCGALLLLWCWFWAWLGLTA